MRWRVGFFFLLGCGTAGPNQGVDAALDATGEAGTDSPSDCVFPSGRVCPNGQSCIGDDLCNGCTCNDGALGCTAMACTMLDGGACAQTDGGWVPTACAHNGTEDFACARDMPATPYAFDCDVFNTADAGCPQDGCRPYYIDLWCCPAP